MIKQSLTLLVAAMTLTVFLQAGDVLGATQIATDFSNIIKADHYYLKNGLHSEPNCTMTYDDALVDTLGAAFRFGG